METALEQSRPVPLLYDADVAVAGAGIAGMFAALAAAQMGTRTVVVDRFGDVGGNLGPGLIAGGGLASAAGRGGVGVVGGYRGRIVRTFQERFNVEEGVRAPQGQNTWIWESSRAAYVLRAMAREAGVDLLLSTYIADPILENRTVQGLFVETKSGRCAIRAKLVIDATGDADLARRAGAPVITPSDPIEPEVTAAIQRAKAAFGGTITPVEMHLLEDQLAGRSSRTGLYAIIANVDWQRFEEFRQTSPGPTPADLEWYAQSSRGAETPNAEICPFLPLLRQACQAGELRLVVPVDQRAGVRLSKLFHEGAPEARLAAIRTVTTGHVDSGDAEQTSRMEIVSRDYVYDVARFLRQRVPGFERSFLAFTAPFLGARGGPSIRGEVTLSAPDFLEKHRTFPDVMYIYDLHTDFEARLGNWVDVPYRVMVPIELEGLLAAGRSAAARRQLRTRISLMHMGEAAGMAAALAVKAGVQPRHLDIKSFQKHLLAAGFYLGDDDRLRELGLS